MIRWQFLDLVLLSPLAISKTGYSRMIFPPCEVGHGSQLVGPCRWIGTHFARVEQPHTLGLLFEDRAHVPDAISF